MKFLLLVGKEVKKAHETQEDVVSDEVWIKSGDVKGQARLEAIIRDPNGDTGSCQSNVHVCVHACVCQ